MDNYILGINAAIVAKGITAGIEKASKILMPMLFILLVLISIRSITLPGSEEGLSFFYLSQILPPLNRRHI